MSILKKSSILKTAPIYTDWQSSSGYEGEGRLIKQLAKGLPFLFHDDVPEKQLRYFYCDKWLVELNGFTTQRCLLKEITSRRPAYRDLDKESKIEDKFLIIHGIEVF